jgi:glycosyltransferase involved in cell wall biosynthesis
MHTSGTEVSAVSSDCELRVPADDVADPELTILIPALDEELTIGLFMDWCHEGIGKSGARTEILIVDSSKDRTAEIAHAKGARVLATPKRGLGRAYIDAIPFVRGRCVLMGDADCTYDFREIKSFVEAFRAGAEFIMGSRFKGTIDPGSMPKLHQYFGTPLTTFILNFMFSSRFSDIHCGMRGLSYDALLRMDLQSQGWEYASEMIVKSLHMKLRTTELPVHFHVAPAGRLSHFKRRGWLEPWLAGGMTLRTLMVYGLDFFLIKPGAILLILGAALLATLTFGPVRIGRVSLSLNSMLFGMTSATFGLTMVLWGAVARILYDYTNTARQRLERIFPFNPTVASCVGVGTVGLLATVPMIHTFFANHYALPSGSPMTHWAITGLWLAVASFQVFIFAVMIQTLKAILPKWRDAEQPAVAKRVP